MDQLSTSLKQPRSHREAVATNDSQSLSPIERTTAVPITTMTSTMHSPLPRDFTSQPLQGEHAKRSGLAVLMTNKQQQQLLSTELPSSSSISPLSAFSPSSRKPKVTAFVIDLTSPVSILPYAAPDLLAYRKHAIPERFRKFQGGRTNGIDDEAQMGLPTADGEALSPTPEEIYSQLSAKNLQASLNRSAMLHERRNKLQHRADIIKRRVLLQRHKERLINLKRRTRFEYSLSTATVRHQILLQQRAEKFGAIVEYAQNVAMIKRLERCIKLRRSVSTSFAELVSSQGEIEHLLNENPNITNYTPTSPTHNTATAIVYRKKLPSPSLQTGHHINEVETLSNTEILTNYEQTIIFSPKSASTTSTVSPIHSIGKNTASNSANSPKISPTLSITSSTKPIILIRSLSMPITLLPEHSLDFEEQQNHNRISENLKIIDRVAARPTLTIDIPFTASVNDFLPPITRYTLRELDVSEILSNAQLRHDLIFDPDMAFRPNTDGERGNVKQTKTEQYWNEVAIEIVEAAEGKRPWLRIPLLIVEIREVLLELVSYNKDFESIVNEKLDTELLMQQLRQGTINFVGAMEFVAHYLHQYCAPCRDELVNKMLEQFKEGELIKGFRQCFDIMEYMKLDFANHHMKKLRPWVIENAAEYEWKHMKEQLDSHTITSEETQSWLTGACNIHLTKNAAEIYNEALIYLMTIVDSANSKTRSGLPETMRLDLSRLVTFHNDWQDLSIMCSLMMLFRQAAGPKCGSDDLLSLKKTLWVLLNDGETSMEHVTLQLVHSAGKVRGTTYTERETKLMSTLVDKTLAIESKVYELIQGRIRQHLVSFLATGKLNEEAMKKHGLAELHEELSDLAERVKALADHNRRTYAPLYNTIYNNWKAKRDAAANNTITPTAT